MREVAYRTKPTSTEDRKLVFTYSNAVVRKYSWGLDLSGWSGDASSSALHGAGGIDGLLAAVETSGTHAGSYWYLYDANGNVGQVLDATDPQSITPAAHYEYDPYGNTLRADDVDGSGVAGANRFRFSTKYLDDELATAGQGGAVGSVGLYYYGYRYYSPGLGRWISRDPIGEEGGINLQQFVHNCPTGHVDPRGLTTWAWKLCNGLGRVKTIRIEQLGCFSASIHPNAISAANLIADAAAAPTARIPLAPMIKVYTATLNIASGRCSGFVLYRLDVHYECSLWFTSYWWREYSRGWYRVSGTYDSLTECVADAQRLAAAYTPPW